MEKGKLLKKNKWLNKDVETATKINTHLIRYTLLKTAKLWYKQYRPRQVILTETVKTRLIKICLLFFISFHLFSFVSMLVKFVPIKELLYKLSFHMQKYKSLLHTRFQCCQLLSIINDPKIIPQSLLRQYHKKGIKPLENIFFCF